MSGENGTAAASAARNEVMAAAMAVAGDPPAPQLRSLVCPYCGSVTPDSGRCLGCGGRFDPLSRQATQNQMGPWVIRDERSPFRPGCTYDTLVRLVDQGKIGPETVLRGPTTRQFWMLARHAPGVASRMGMCHSCQSPVKPDAFACPSCHASFSVERDRQHLGLGPARPLPGQGMPEVLALRAEPPSAGGGGGAIASTAIASPGGGGVRDAGDAGDAGGAGLGASPGVGSGGAELAMISQQAQKQVEEANRLARRWRARSQANARHAWVVIGVSCVVTLAALVYAMRTANTNAGSSASGQTERIQPHLSDE